MMFKFAGNSIQLNANAKVNLSLDIVGLRDDGYHEIKSVICPIDLHDDVKIRLKMANPQNRFTLKIVSEKVDIAEIGPPEKNLAVRAAKEFLDEIGASNIGADIEIVKRIPLGGGLGGGSADAAATLRALNTLTNNPFSSLVEIASRLGSDIPAMTLDTVAIMEGRGEYAKPYKITTLEPFYIVLANPKIHVSTASAYKLCDKILTKTNFCDNILYSHNCRCGLENCAAWLFNGMENAVFSLYPAIGELKRLLIRAGAKGALMSGSGASVFALVESFEEAQKVAQAVPAEYWCIVTRLLPDGVTAAHGPLEA